MPSSNFEDILSRMHKLLEEAYEAGRAQERENMKRNVLAVFSTPEKSDTTAAITHAERSKTLMTIISDERRKHGTVKSAIKALIENAKEGILTSEIIEKTVL